MVVDPAIEKILSEASSERTRDFMKSNSPSSIPRRTKERCVEATIASADDEECRTLHTQAEWCPFPECTESVAAKLAKTSARVTDVLQEAAVQFERVSRVARDMEEEKSHLVREVTEAEAKAWELVKREAATLAAAEVAKAKNALLRAEAETAKCREAAVVASQVDLLRVFAERIFLSGRFFTPASELASMLNTYVIATTLNQVAVDYLDLDKSKFRYEVTLSEVLLWVYAEVLSEGIEGLPVVECLASSSTLLTAEVVRAFLMDRYAILEAVIANLGSQAEEPTTKSAEVHAKVEAEKQAEEQLEEEQAEEATGRVS